jgi:hypothetical protein
MTAHFWIERAALWDQHLDEIKRRQIEASIVDDAKAIAGEHMGMLAKARKIASIELAKLLERTEGSSHANVRVGELTRLIDATVKLDRLIRGEATEIVETGDDLDFSNMPDEDLAQLHAMLSKAKGENAVH